MATAVTWGRWRVASLLAWALPGLVMRVPEDPAKSNLKPAETRFAPYPSERQMVSSIRLLCSRKTLKQEAGRRAKRCGRETASQPTTLRGGRQICIRSTRFKSAP